MGERKYKVNMIMRCGDFTLKQVGFTVFQDCDLHVCLERVDVWLSLEALLRAYNLYEDKRR